MLATVSQGFWESFSMVIRLILCGAFGGVAILGASIWYDAKDSIDWYHIFLGRTITIIALAGLVLSILVVRA